MFVCVRVRERMCESVSQCVHRCVCSQAHRLRSPCTGSVAGTDGGTSPPSHGDLQVEQRSRESGAIRRSRSESESENERERERERESERERGEWFFRASHIQDGPNK